MRKPIFKVSLLFNLIACLSVGISYHTFAKKDVPNSLTKKEKKDGWILLSDGKTFEGWHGYNHDGMFDCLVVDDDRMKMTTEGEQESQDVITDKIYKSFELKFDFMLTKGANSGVIFQVKEDPKYKFPCETGPEFQVIDHDNWLDKLEDWQICSANYTMYPPSIKSYKYLSELADFPDYGKYDEGHISFQNHGTNVFYRSIKIKEL